MSFRAVSTFWIAHPNNNLINNAAAGSQVNNTKVHLCFCILVCKCPGLCVYATECVVV